MLELERRREVSGKRLRQLWEQEAFEKQSRQIQVKERQGGGRKVNVEAEGKLASWELDAAAACGRRDTHVVGFVSGMTGV